MNPILRLLKYAVAAALGACGAFVILFAGYGWSHGFDVWSGLQHVITLSPETVEQQPIVESVPWQVVSWVADIENRELDESSGLAASNVHDDLFWSINDSGSKPYVYAIGMDGADLGTWQVDVATAVDWESMDAFTLDGESYLIIGDTGDNFRWRPTVRLLVVPEPKELLASRDALPVAWEVRYRYPEGYRDSESLGVDVSSETVYVVSKRHYPPEVFSVPLRAKGVVEALKIADLVDIPRLTVREVDEDGGDHYRYSPGGLDIAGDRMLLTTHKHVYLYSLNALGDKPKRIDMPSLGQREAISFARGREDVAYVTRERQGGKGVADLFKVEFSTEPTLSVQTPGAEQTDAQ